MKISTVLFFVILLLSKEEQSISWDKADELAKKWVSDLSTDEKIALTTGRENFTGKCVGSIDPINRKGFKGLCLQDGPAGVRFAKGTSTSWQASINTGATFDRTLMRKVGEAQGKEFYKKGINVALTPSMNIQRAPAAGRIWESFGEDPYFVGQCALEVTKGIQSQGVMVSAKHFIGNDQETNRDSASSNIGEQAFWEVYMEPFYRNVVDGEAMSVMAAYNLVDGTPMTQNKKILTDYLKDKIGFKGFIVSDWWAIKEVEKSFGGGMDMNMPGGKQYGEKFVGDSYWGKNIQSCIDKGVFPKSRLDDAALRIARSIFKANQMDNFPGVNIQANTLTDENVALNRKVGADSNVLLKNDDNILPIKKDKVKKIAIIGKDASPTKMCNDMACADGTVVIGWGSGTTDFKYVVDPISAITKRAKQDGIEVVSSGKDDSNSGANAAKSADIALVFVQADSGEAYLQVDGNAGDRKNLDLWHNGASLVNSVVQANKNTVVVIHSPGPVNLPFLSSVKAIVFAGMPGMEAGNAIADVLFGDVNPSGHLPYTWAKKEDYCCDVSGSKQLDYKEGLFVGYRWFDKQNTEPTFAFGYGLSYTTFEFSKLKATMDSDGMHVSLTVSNTGDVTGAAVPMIFLSFPQDVKDYPKLLFKGFDKVSLGAGESKEVSILIDNHDLSYYDTSKKDFVKPTSGTYTVYAGSNARDLPLKVTVEASNSMF